MSANEPTNVPEPRREDYASAEEHSSAWMRWAETTPGGWRARVAEHVAAADPPKKLLPPPADAAPGDGARGDGAPAEEVPAASGSIDDGVTSCCEATVVLDPLVEGERRRGLCADCCVLVDDFGDRWEPV